MLWVCQADDADAPYAPQRHLPNPSTIKTYLYPTNRPKRDYQYDIVRACFTDNCLVALPTGLGKTFVAGVVMLNCTFQAIVSYKTGGKIGELLISSLPMVSYRKDRLPSSNETTCESTDRGMPDDVWDTE